ncbi:MAG: hypothetical protein ACJAT4_000074 [Granulosicoccus sp.]|jgi:hypothetical protein
MGSIESPWLLTKNPFASLIAKGFLKNIVLIFPIFEKPWRSKSENPKSP